MKRIIFYLLITIFMLQQDIATAQTYAAGACAPIPNSKTCVDSTPCKTDSSGRTVCLSGVATPSGALSVAQSCWQFNYKYACKDASASLNTCTNSAWYNASTCSIVNSSCATYQTNADGTIGSCQVYNYTYSCQTQAAQNGSTTTCTTGIGGLTAQTTHPQVTNNNAGLAAATMEIANQIATYTNGGTTSAFVGTQESCTKGYFGLKNCCGSSPGASSNSQIVSMATGNAIGVAKYAGQKAIDTASPYVFDAMYATGAYTNGLNTALTTSGNVTSSVITTMTADGAEVAATMTQATGTTFASGGLSFGAFGFTYGTGTFSGGWGAIQIGGPLTDAAGEATGVLLEMESGFLAFNPYVFAAQIAIMVVTQLMSCTQPEQLLAMHKGVNLSVFTNETCTKKVPIIGTCLEYEDRYCSFNSLLAKLINQQGKAQLGVNFADCSGLSLSQLSQLDFTKINLSEFAAQMVSKAQAALPNTGTLPSGYTNSVKNGGSGKY